MGGEEFSPILEFEMARIRSFKRTKHLVTSARKTVDFARLWRKLRGLGWTAKKPKGLSNEWTYYIPDASGETEERGVTFFIGMFQSVYPLLIIIV